MCSVARARPLLAHLSGSSLALIGAGDRRRIDWRFFVLGLRLLRWISHQRVSLRPFVPTLHVWSGRVPTPAIASASAYRPPGRGFRAREVAIDSTSRARSAGYY